MVGWQPLNAHLVPWDGCSRWLVYSAVVDISNPDSPWTKSNYTNGSQTMANDGSVTCSGYTVSDGYRYTWKGCDDAYWFETYLMTDAECAAFNGDVEDTNGDTVECSKSYTETVMDYHYKYTSGSGGSGASVDYRITLSEPAEPFWQEGSRVTCSVDGESGEWRDESGEACGAPGAGWCASGGDRCGLGSVSEGTYRLAVYGPAAMDGNTARVEVCVATTCLPEGGDGGSGGSGGSGEPVTTYRIDRVTVRLEGKSQAIEDAEGNALVDEEGNTIYEYWAEGEADYVLTADAGCTACLSRVTVVAVDYGYDDAGEVVSGDPDAGWHVVDGCAGCCRTWDAASGSEGPGEEGGSCDTAVDWLPPPARVRIRLYGAPGVEQAVRINLMTYHQDGDGGWDDGVPSAHVVFMSPVASIGYDEIEYDIEEPSRGQRICVEGVEIDDDDDDDGDDDDDDDDDDGDGGGDE
jgi:hypothetical protein